MVPAAANSEDNVRRRSSGAVSKWKVHGVLTLVQCSYAAAGIVIKMACSGGINLVVFAVYKDIVSVCFLVPVAFYSERGRRGVFDWTTLALTVLLGSIILYAGQLLIVFGISLAPASYASLLGITIPTFVFVISVASGLEEIQWTRRGGQAKVIGLLSAVCGGALILLYQGPVIIGSLQGTHVVPLSELPLDHGHEILAAILSNLKIEDWQLGGFLLILTGFLQGVYWSLQAHIIKRFPAPVSASALAHVGATTMLTATGILTFQNRSDWGLPQRSDIFAVLYAGFVSSGMNLALQSWAVAETGPVLSQAYAPLQSCATVAVAYFFLGESIHLGSVLGLLWIITGLSSITWGQVTSRKEAGHPVKPLTNALAGVSIIKGDSDLEQQLLE